MGLLVGFVFYWRAGACESGPLGPQANWQELSQVAVTGSGRKK